MERSKSSGEGEGEDRLESFVAKYVQFIIRPPVAFAICLCWLAFLILSAIGISHFQVNLSTKKLFASDSPLLEIDHYREEDIVPIFTVATVFVNNPGNLSDARRMGRLNQLVQSMEELPGNWGPPSTNYFIRELAEFVGDEEAETPLMERLGEFLEWPEHRYWKAFLRLRNGNGTNRQQQQQQQQQQLDRFFFTTAFHGQQLREWPERTNLLKEWRTVVDQFREDLNATVFHEEGIFLDLIDNMPSDAWQSSVATLLCMCLICAIFMGHDWRTVLVAGTTIGSIIVGTLGILAWMGVSMDPIMMAALIISIGFSVDIPAHVSYHFHSSAYEANAPSTSSPSKSPIVVLPLFVRLHSTLVSIGPPALQASLSTSLCVLALLFVPLYMAQIFVRIMLSCIFLCVLHSLLLIPALFSLIELAKSLFTPTDHHK